MNLIVDIGNTLVKLAVFDGGRIVAQRCVERLQPSMLGELLEGRRAAKAVVASTRGEADDVVETVRPYADYLLEFTSQTPVPVANAYHTPETLGRDRLAAAVGALTAAWLYVRRREKELDEYEQLLFSEDLDEEEAPAEEAAAPAAEPDAE